MTISKGARRRDVDAAVASFMIEFARLLVGAGITSTKYSSIARMAYFVAATELARFRNDRLNQSAVAAITGLSRSEVRRFAKQAAPLPKSSRDRVEAIIEVWSTDPLFVTSSYSPKRLRIAGEGITFKSLVQRHGGDIPPRSLLRELQRHGHVTLRNGIVSLNKNARHTRDEFRLSSVLKVLTDLIKPQEDSRNVNSAPVRGIVLETSFPATSAKGRAMLQRRFSENLGAFISGINAIGVASSLESPPSIVQKKKVTRARIALVTEDIE